MLSDHEPTHVTPDGVVHNSEYPGQLRLIMLGLECAMCARTVSTYHLGCVFCPRHCPYGPDLAAEGRGPGVPYQ